MYTSVEICRSGEAFEESFFHAVALCGILLNYREKANCIVNSLKVPSLTFSINYSWLKKPIAFLLMLPSLLFSVQPAFGRAGL